MWLWWGSTPRPRLMKWFDYSRESSGAWLISETDLQLSSNVQRTEWELSCGALPVGERLKFQAQGVQNAQARAITLLEARLIELAVATPEGIRLNPRS